jgi:2-oxoglutarate dehydrogenase E1 component
MDIWHDFPGPNAAYVLDLYERFQQDPQSVDAATRAYFERRPPALVPLAELETTFQAATVPAFPFKQIVAVARLAQAIRGYGHRAAALDPLGSPPPGDPALELSNYGLSEADLTSLPAELVGGPCAVDAGNAQEVLARLRSVYCGTIGYDYDHIHDPEERAWLRAAAEEQRFRPPADPIDSVALLQRLTEVEVFEQFLHRVFPGRTRFSIEGLDMLVPMLDEVVARAAAGATRRIFIGMAHRGRLNVLAHILNKPYAQILAEFKDPVAGHNFAVRDNLGWTGDVKYHKGAMRAVRVNSDGTQDGPGNSPEESHTLRIDMPPNPSHLEYIDPVVMGMARAAATDMSQAGAPRFDPAAALPVLIHGDASFPGQGIVAETLNLTQVWAYQTGGALHIIANNQLGFTTNPEQERSTSYASDLAKGFNIPVVHVNADDPVACLEATRLASAYRACFRKDFLIDLIGYRRYGHNEGDEPSFTQPLLYQAIERHPSVRKLWANALVAQGLIPPDEPERLIRHVMEGLQAVLDALRAEQEVVEPQIVPPPRGMASRARTTVKVERLLAANEALLQLPPDFALNPKLSRAIKRRRDVVTAEHADEPGIDWATAEQLAIATILQDGTPVRLTGQDAERGTFSQRHAVFHDFKTSTRYVPLQHLPGAQAGYIAGNSPLSENAALGFEFGYSVQAPERLVLWEAQYGDFVNGAQGIVDEFVVSARAKWEQTPALVLLLPHGYEGQGPDHSSARLERFLQSAAEINLRIAYPTTAAQYFHLLRRQATLLESDPLPLVVLTPKSLLRHPLAGSSLRELAEGAWRPVLDDAQAHANPEGVRRLILCSGKIYVDLVSSPRRDPEAGIAIVRLEQIYPFPVDALRVVLDGYPNLEMVIWVQEEPENMGAWNYVRVELGELCHDCWQLHFVGRPPSSSPAEGSSALHTVNQTAIVEQALNLEGTVEQREIVWLKKA